jgi:hypothetical protein
VFGLVHGLGFADALSPLALTGWPLIRALAGFNLGVELGQMIAISLVLPIMFVLGRLASAVPVYRYASLAPDSALEGGGFEPSVPLQRVIGVFGRVIEPPAQMRAHDADGAGSGDRLGPVRGNGR